MPRCEECGAAVEYSFLGDDGALYKEQHAIPAGTEGVIVCPKCIAFVGEPFAYSPENWSNALQAAREANQPEPTRPAVAVWCQSCDGQFSVDLPVITRVFLNASTNWSGQPGTFTAHASRMNLEADMQLRCPLCDYEGIYHITSTEVRNDLQQMWRQ